MPNKFCGVRVSFTEVSKYFNAATGYPIGNFDHFAFVTDIPSTSGNDQEYLLTVYAVNVDGTIANNQAPVPATKDNSAGHTRPATNPHLKLSVLRLYFEQLQVLYPAGVPNASELRVYPHNFIGNTGYMAYAVETDNSQSLITQTFNPSPPRENSRTF